MENPAGTGTAVTTMGFTRFTVISSVHKYRFQFPPYPHQRIAHRLFAYVQPLGDLPVIVPVQIAVKHLGLKGGKTLTNLFQTEVILFLVDEHLVRLGEAGLGLLLRAHLL